jgi:hypothetical protein
MPSVSPPRPGADSDFKARLLADLVATATGEVLLILAGWKIMEHVGPLDMMRVVVELATTDTTAWS